MKEQCKILDAGLDERFCQDDIQDMLGRICLLPDNIKDITCLSKALDNYVFEIQQYFKGNSSVERVLQEYHREVGCNECLRCGIQLNDKNYRYTDKLSEFICNICCGRGGILE